MASARGSCKHNTGNFCYVCGVFLNVKSVKYNIVEGNLFCSAYKAYFGVQVGDQDKSWAPGQPLVEQEKILMPPLHIKLGRKAICEGTTSQVRCHQASGSGIPRLSEAKVRQGYLWAAITKQCWIRVLRGKLLAPDKRAWRSFVAVVQGFLGKNKEENYRELVDDLLKSYKGWVAGCP
ncbi:Uncharacterized protein FKW44_002252 [Caligus rogercresseyi]|uniref:Uncharacterized protein n=1 Tax=Caligus rogercresseyi TaxID=217165 RepID=A0A7T8KJX8_CALRO|nr:Uncharacterized protein FKW44_002252 [Caligus rogercresseyi]